MFLDNQRPCEGVFQQALCRLPGAENLSKTPLHHHHPSRQHARSHAGGLVLTHCLEPPGLSAEPGWPWALPDLHPTWLPAKASCGFLDRQHCRVASGFPIASFPRWHWPKAGSASSRPYDLEPVTCPPGRLRGFPMQNMNTREIEFIILFIFWRRRIYSLDLPPSVAQRLYCSNSWALATLPPQLPT